MAHEHSRTSSNTEDDKTPSVQPYLEGESDDRAFHDHPQFHRHAEATNAELFYDLFFVANLTVFTNVHEVRDQRRNSSLRHRLIVSRSTIVIR